MCNTSSFIIPITKSSFDPCFASNNYIQPGALPSIHWNFVGSCLFRREQEVRLQILRVADQAQVQAALFRPKRRCLASKHGIEPLNKHVVFCFFRLWNQQSGNWWEIDGKSDATSPNKTNSLGPSILHNKTHFRKDRKDVWRPFFGPYQNVLREVDSKLQSKSDARCPQLKFGCPESKPIGFSPHGAQQNPPKLT